VNTIVKTTALLIAGVAGGIWSAHRGIENAGVAYGGSPWKTWTRDTVNRSPYADAHFMLAGQLPMPASQFIVYEARGDSDGRNLDGDCTYVVEGKLPAVRWWSLGASEQTAGRELPQQLASVKAITDASGKIYITIAPNAVPGNWIPVGNGSKFMLTLVLHDPARRGESLPGPDELPSIQRTACS
jgi:hypothetical protein